MPKLLAILFLCLCILLFSCSKKQTPPFQRGVQYLNANQSSAEEAFLEAIATHDHYAEACLQYAELCSLQTPKYPLAIYYYDQYLKLQPNASNAEEIKKNIAQLEKKLAISLNKKNGDDVLDEQSLRIKLLEQHVLKQKQWIEDLNVENQKLRRQLLAQP